MTVRTPALLTAAEEWVSWTPEQKRHLLESAQAERARRLRASWQAYPWQRPHIHPPGFELLEGLYCHEACLALPRMTEVPAHDVVLILGGRGIGKTDGCAQYVLDHVDGPACNPRIPGGHRIAIVAPTIGDAVESCVEGPSGLRAYDPRVKAVGTRAGTVARFPNGARARLFGAHSQEDVNRLRSGGNTCLVWLEEAAAQRYLPQVLEHAAFGLRTGPSPHFIVSTTPKPRPEVKAWMSDPHTHVTVGRTRDAIHLPVAAREALERKYAGTRIGQQELEGRILSDVEGALWSWLLIDAPGTGRVAPGTEPLLVRIVVAVDPNAGGPDECGIVVVGISRDRFPDKNGRLERHVYVLEDGSDHFPHPGRWAAKVVQLYKAWGADAVVAEINNGGDMVPHTIRTVDPSVRCITVSATRGKARRAEPVVSLYEQHRVHHVGGFPKLEAQMTGWVDEPGADSPDRMDALVWGVTELALPKGGSSMVAVV